MKKKHYLLTEDGLSEISGGEPESEKPTKNLPPINEIRLEKAAKKIAENAKKGKSNDKGF